MTANMIIVLVSALLIVLMIRHMFALKGRHADYMLGLLSGLEGKGGENRRRDRSTRR